MALTGFVGLTNRTATHVDLYFFLEFRPVKVPSYHFDIPILTKIPYDLRIVLSLEDLVLQPTNILDT